MNYKRYWGYETKTDYINEMYDIGCEEDEDEDDRYETFEGWYENMLKMCVFMTDIIDCLDMDEDKIESFKEYISEEI